MTKQPKLEDCDDPRERTGIATVGARLTWVILGPMALFLIVITIVSGGRGWTTWLDAAFGAVVGLMLFGRWVEQRSGKAMTATGEPSTVADVRRYALVLLVMMAAVWVGANVLGNHILD